MKKLQEEIAKDLNRTFPKHILFKDKQSLGQEQLFQVLRSRLRDIQSGGGLLPGHGFSGRLAPELHA